MMEPEHKAKPRLADHPMLRPGTPVTEGGGQESARAEARGSPGKGSTGTDDQGLPAEAVFKRAFGRPTDLYAVIDAARDSRGQGHAHPEGSRGESLFAGPVGQQLEGVAPHLARFETDSSLWRWWYQQWGNSVGVLMQTPVSLAELRAHFRTLMVVRGEDRRKYFFRFYDPRVLRVFLPNCTPEEVRRFFGPVTAFHCEGPEGSELLTFKLGHDGVMVERRPVATPGST